jgi:hypothetical protein
MSRIALNRARFGGECLVSLPSVPATALASMAVVHHRGTVPAAAVSVVAAAVGAQDESAPEDHGDDEDRRGDCDGRCGNAIDPGVSVAPTPALRRFGGPRCHCERFGGGFDCLLS